MNSTRPSANRSRSKIGGNYPSTPQIKRVVGAFRSAGVQVGSVSISVDGTIRVYDRELIQGDTGAADEFTWYERAGKL